MNSQQLTAIAIKSCTDMYEQLEVMQKGSNPKDNRLVSMVTNEVKNIEMAPNYAILTLTVKVDDPDSLGLCLNDQETFFNEVVFDHYDENSMTIRLQAPQSLLSRIASSELKNVKVISDLKWLVNATRECYEKHGDRLGYPRFTPCFRDEEIVFPSNLEPNKEQKRAVREVLNNKLTYVWGAPGTGKTQFVLATSAIAHIRRGERIAIIAPTNNAVEQALRGVLRVISMDPSHRDYININKDVIRLGSASKEFISDYKDICENRAKTRLVEKLRDTNQTISKIIFYRKLDHAKSYLDFIIDSFAFEYDKADPAHQRMLMEKIMDAWDQVKVVLMGIEGFSAIIDNIDEYNIRTRIEDVVSLLAMDDQYELGINEYKDKNIKELRQIIASNLQTIAENSSEDACERAIHAKIMAMTPFVLMTRKGMFEPGGIIDVDHIFVDEVGYSNLIQMFPVFMCGAPITMLGDHMQLPPVCELDADNIKKWCERGGYMKYSFMWDTSARHAETLLRGDIDEVRDAYLSGSEPIFHDTVQVDLTTSHRFGNNLAAVLDECVYKNGIKGSQGTLKITYIDIRGSNSESRANEEEAVAISDYLKAHKDLESFAILTPYKKQISLLKQVCGKHYEKNILTVHASQGREWDTVILSVSDNRNSDRDVPYRFTSSIEDNQGLKVINTAVSRAHEELIIVCDYEFWIERAKNGDLLGMLLKNAGPVE